VDILEAMWKTCVRRIVVSKIEGAIEALLAELQIQMSQMVGTKKTNQCHAPGGRKEPKFPEEVAEQVGAVSLRIRPAN
jgi:hypothetical protein